MWSHKGTHSGLQPQQQKLNPLSTEVVWITQEHQPSRACRAESSLGPKLSTVLSDAAPQPGLMGVSQHCDYIQNAQGILSTKQDSSSPIPLGWIVENVAAKAEVEGTNVGMTPLTAPPIPWESDFTLFLIEDTILVFCVDHCAPIFVQLIPPRQAKSSNL